MQMESKLEEWTLILDGPPNTTISNGIIRSFLILKISLIIFMNKALKWCSGWHLPLTTIHNFIRRGLKKDISWIRERLSNGGMDMVEWLTISIPRLLDGGIHWWIKCLIWVLMDSNVMGPILWSFCSAHGPIPLMLKDISVCMSMVINIMEISTTTLNLKIHRHSSCQDRQISIILPHGTILQNIWCSLVGWEIKIHLLRALEVQCQASCSVLGIIT